MHLVIQQSENHNFLHFSNEQFFYLDISAELAQIPYGILKITSEKDFSPHLICKRLEDIDKKISSILLISDQNLDWKFLVRLACHIRYHQFTNGLDKLPITLAFQSIPDLMFDKETLGSGEIENFQYEEGFYIKTWDDVFTMVKDEAGSTVNAYELFFQEKLSDKSFDAALLSIIKISPSHKQGSHAITNFWGAVNLARNAGYSDEETGYEFPPTLYFKYLSKKYKANICSPDERKAIISTALSSNNSVQSAEQLLKDGRLDFSGHKYLKYKKILLIDDNADKGWKSSLSLLFNNDIHVFSELIDINLKDYERFDLVFLDLYMPNPKNDNKPDMAYTINILKELKSKFPGVPIIVFTASNKSWTMNEVLENGADGIYVKESPEYAASPQFSHDNFMSFVNIVINCLEKYSILRPYWELTRLIINDITFKSLPEKGQTQFKNRIIERLEMFYGLLKKRFEQHDYDKNRFHFSDYEMAFMTLWSALNEVSEMFYNKIDNTQFKLFDKNGKSYTCFPIKYKNWKLVTSGDYLMQHDFEFDSYNPDGTPTLLNNSNKPALKPINSKCFIKKNKTNPYYTIDVNSRLVNDEIAPQIAFILLKHFKMSDNHMYLTRLRDLNYLRNKLFLTHGSSVADNFFSDLERNKRLDPDYKIGPTDSIKDLFELITLILTGQEVKLTF